MGAKSEVLAKQFEAKVREALRTLEQLSDSEWKKVTEAEQWSVGVTAHHLAGALEPVSNIVKAVVPEQSLSSFRLDMLDEMNARHAKDYADCTKAETIELLEKGAAAAAAAIRGLNDDQLSGMLVTEAPPMTAEQSSPAARSTISMNTSAPSGRRSATEGQGQRQVGRDRR
jgi:hypothetical protein